MVKNLRRLIAFLLCSIIIMACVSACGGDKDGGDMEDQTVTDGGEPTKNDPETLVGVWTNEKDGSTDTFNADGTMTEVDKAGNTFEATYSVENGTLNIYFWGVTMSYSFEVTGEDTFKIEAIENTMSIDKELIGEWKVTFTDDNSVSKVSFNDDNTAVETATDSEGGEQSMGIGYSVLNSHLYIYAENGEGKTVAMRYQYKITGEDTLELTYIDGVIMS